MATKLPSIPSPLKLDPTVNAIKEIIEVREGLRGEYVDRFVSFRDLLNLLETNEQISTILMDVVGAVTGTNTGDIIRWNATSSAWEVKAEPLAFTQITLSPRAAAVANSEGGVYYNSTSKAVLVCVNI